jgi:hypothetical protein
VTTIYSLIRHIQNLADQVPVLNPPGTEWPSYAPGDVILFLLSATTRRDYCGGILTRLHTGSKEVSLLKRQEEIYHCRLLL